MAVRLRARSPSSASSRCPLGWRAPPTPRAATETPPTPRTSGNCEVDAAQPAYAPCILPAPVISTNADVSANTTSDRLFLVEIVEAGYAADGEIFCDAEPAAEGFYDVDLDPKQSSNRSTILLNPAASPAEGPVPACTREPFSVVRRSEDRVTQVCSYGSYL